MDYVSNPFFKTILPSIGFSNQATPYKQYFFLLKIMFRLKEQSQNSGTFYFELHKIKIKYYFISYKHVGFYEYLS